MPNVLLSFEDLHAGDIVNGQYASNGVTISSGDAANPPMIFDTSNPTGGDDDLETGNLGNVLILSEDGDSSDPDDEARGGKLVFTFDDPTQVLNFKVLDIEEAGHVKLWDANGDLIATLPLPMTGDNGQAVMDVNYDGVTRMEVTLGGSGAIDNICFCTPDVDDPDGIVTGSAGHDLIDVAYTGDPEGDMIDAGDAIIAGEAPDDDIVDALGGDDSIFSGEGDDEVYAGGGNDYVEGGAGDDIIYGDSNYGGTSGGTSTVRESLEWNEEAGFGNGNSASGFTQNTGTTNVTFSILNESGASETEYETDTQYVTGIEADGSAVDDNSSLYSVLNGDNNQADYKLEFDNAVEDVSFRVNDIDGDGVIRITAFDASGNPISVDLTGGSKLTMSDTNGVAGNDTATSQGGYASDNTASYSLLVTIPGPVSSIVIEHNQDGSDNTGVNITDVYFDALIADTSAPGNDTIFGDAGNDVIYGEDGDDNLYGGTGDDIIEGGDGDDFIDGGSGQDTLSGGAGEDTILGSDERDTIDGGADDDHINAGGNIDTVDGGDGDDYIFGGTGNDIIDGGAGDDTIEGGDDNDVIDGGTGDDLILGQEGADTIIGGDGNDTVYGGIGNDIIDTSGNVNAFGISGSPDLGYPGLFPGDADPFDDRDYVEGGKGDDVISTGDDNDVIFGGEGRDIIDGGFDQDEIDGGFGNDRIVGGEGSDTILGGAGDDVIYAGIDPDLGLPDNLDIADVDGDLVTNNGMDYVDGGSGDDTIYGQDDDDTLIGGSGDDYIDGGVDNDTITGGIGNDTIIGGQGADTLSGGDDRDTFLGGDAGDTVDGGDGGDDYDTLDLSGSDVDFITYTSADREDGVVTFGDGSTMSFEEIENVVPCFTPGTLIATPKGERMVEELVEGDKIITRDNGIQEIRWIGEKQVDARHLMNNPHLKPVMIKAGALGAGLPERDMMVSPNHRVLVSNERTALYFEEREVLAAAKHLIGSEGIHEVDVMGTSYLHMMFDQHEVVLSNGAWTESFQPGDYSLKGIGNAQRNEIFELFPELKTAEGLGDYQSARKSLKKHEARLLVR